MSVRACTKQMNTSLYSVQVDDSSAHSQVTHTSDNANPMYAEVASFSTMSSSSPKEKAPETVYTVVEYRQTDTNVDEDTDSD